MFKGATSSQGGDLNGFLDAGSRMSGTLTFEDTFRIDGHFDGTINAAGDLIVGEGGEVEAEVTARRVFISGTVRGSVRALDRLEITKIGKVFADLTTPSLSVEDGAFLEGRCSMNRAGAESKQRPSNVESITAVKKTGA